MIDLIKKSQELFLSQDMFSRDRYKKQLGEMGKNSKNIIIVTGQRRVGKSFVVIDYLQQEIQNTKNIFYLNKEFDISGVITNQDDLELCFQAYSSEYSVSHIVIDEIQDIDGWEHFIRAKYAEKKYTIIITGSNSKLLSSELSTYLTGRYISLEIFPLSYQEVLNIQNSDNTQQSFLQYLEFGGLPEVVLETNTALKKNYIKNLRDAIILKDVVQRYKIKDYALFEKILIFLSENIGSISSLRNIENYFKKENVHISLSTLSNYIKYLENIFFVHACERYDLQGKKILEHSNKYYFNDIGIRNSLYYNYNFDIGKLLENYVYNILVLHNFQVYVGETKNLEIDFVAQRENTILYIQVCYLIPDEKVYQREFGNLKQIHDNHPKIVLSLDQVIFQDADNIQHISLLDFEEYISKK